MFASKYKNCRGGVGVILGGSFTEKVKEVGRLSERTIIVKIVLENIVLNVVSTYAPLTRLYKGTIEQYLKKEERTIWGGIEFGGGWGGTRS